MVLAQNQAGNKMDVTKCNQTAKVYSKSLLHEEYQQIKEEHKIFHQGIKLLTL